MLPRAGSGDSGAMNFRWLSPDEFAHPARSPARPEHVEQFQQARCIWRNRNSVLRGVSRPTEVLRLRRANTMGRSRFRVGYRRPAQTW